MINIRTRLTAQFVLLVTLILLVFSLGVYFFSRLYLEKRFYNRLQDRAITATTLLFDIPQRDTTVLQLIEAAVKNPLLNENISVYNKKTNQFLFSTNPANNQLHKQILPALTEGTQTNYLRQNEYQLIAIHLTKAENGNWIIVSGIDQSGADALDDLKKILLIMILAAILVLGIAGWFFASRALAPMSGIIQQVNSIYPANVEKRVEHANRADEIGELVATFNHLLDRIEQAMTTQKMFIANVSHELKNPLTKINSQIDVALIQQRSPAVYERTLQSLREDVRTLTHLTNTLLELASASVQSGNLPYEPVRMDELLWEVKAQYQKWHPDCQVQLQFINFPDEEEPLLTQGNRPALRVMLMNLLDNACKFSPTRTAQIDFTAKNDQVTVAFFNEGPTILAADLPYIFQPFFRSNATAQSTQGYGVGLAVVAQITQLHQGDISVRSTAEGTTFTLVLPSMTES